MVDVEVGLSDDNAKKDRFNALIQLLRVSNWLMPLRERKIVKIAFLLKQQMIGDDLLKERLEIETLESLKLITKKENFNQKYIKIKTRLL